MEGGKNGRREEWKNGRRESDIKVNIKEEIMTVPLLPLLCKHPSPFTLPLSS